MKEKPKLVGRGGCSDVYLLSEERVLKASTRRAHSHALEINDWQDHDAIGRAQFRAEVNAYERLRSMPELNMYTPIYYGVIDPYEALQLRSDDRRYLEGCGIILERIPGRDMKLAHLEASLEEKVSVVAELLRDKLQLDNVWDASCFSPGSRAEFTLIDFAYWHAEEYEIALGNYGVLSDAERDKLEKENVA